MSDLKLYIEVKEQGNIKNTKARPARKIYSGMSGMSVLGLPNQEIREVVQYSSATPWTDISHIYQAVYLVYQEIKSKDKVKSKWSKRIIKKINNASRSIDILLEARSSSSQPGEEMRNGKMAMRALGLVLERKDDVIEAISRPIKRAALYQRKLNTCEKRKDFTHTYMKYELQRFQFILISAVWRKHL